MKSLLWGFSLALLLGCPLYDEDCSSGQDCAEGFSCDGFSQRCVPISTFASCTQPEDCAAAETCTPAFLCQPGSCDYHGCVAGYTCAIIDGAHACVAPGASPLGDAGADAGEAALPMPADAGAAISDAAANDAGVDGGVSDASSDASP